ncbi:MAG: ATP-binding protein [Acidobacteriaceae bacterium]|nr:ATP-binding protein [Acidobacteriaceae bacterium]
MKPLLINLRTRLTLWYIAVLAAVLLVYAGIVFAFQYVVLTKQIVHDEVQEVVTVEGLFYFDANGQLQLHQDYYSRPHSHLLIDRLMEVRDGSGTVLYRSPTLHGMELGGAPHAGEGDKSFNERITRLADGSHALLISHIHGMQGKQLLIRLGYRITLLHERMFQFFLILLIAIPAALLLAGVAGQSIAKRALLPLDEMANRARTITARNLQERLQVHNEHDELGRLAQIFNHLLDRLQQSFEQLQRFTADASHELRTPIAAMRTIGEVALAEPQPEAVYREALGDILESSARLNDTVDALLLLSRAEAMQSVQQETAWPLQQVVAESLTLLEVLLEEKRMRVRISSSAPNDVLVRAERTLLRTAVMNVLHNAVKFADEDSVLDVVYAQKPEHPNLIELVIEDEGPGIAEGEQDRVFDRFFTRTPTHTVANNGTGLGLSITKLIVERLGGSIRFDPSLRSGARCIITLPVAT